MPTFFDCFYNRNLEKAFDITNNVILVGDLNEDLLNSNYRNLRDILLINSLQNVITDATRLDAIVDLILISDDMAYIDAGVINTPAHISGHKAPFVVLPFQYDPHGTFTRLVWLYKKPIFLF